MFSYAYYLLQHFNMFTEYIHSYTIYEMETYYYNTGHGCNIMHVLQAHAHMHICTHTKVRVCVCVCVLCYFEYYIK